MANINENQIDQVMGALEMSTINQSLAAIMAVLPLQGTITFTPEQLEGMLSMDVDNRVQVQKVIEEMKGAAAAILPAYFTVTKIENDNTLNEQMRSIIAGLQNVTMAAMFIERLTAHEAVGGGNAAYAMIKAAAAAGIPGAQAVYERLKTRFDGQGGSGAPQAGLPG